jgi:hypothetical protein
MRKTAAPDIASFFKALNARLASFKVSTEVIENKLPWKWCARGDDFRTFLGEFLSSLSETDLIVGLNA